MSEGRLPALREGDVVGSWVIDEILSPGPPVRYRAHHVEVDTSHADLILEARTPANEASQRRTVDALKRIDHITVPQLRDFGVDEERNVLYVATEAVDGELVSDAILQGPMPWPTAMRVFHGVGNALAHIHALGLAHRDITPQNIIIAHDGTARLVGFGLAMDQDELERAARAPLGSLRYVAPEVIADPNHHGPRSDLYSLGVVLFETITGQTPFPAAAWGERIDPERRMLEWKTRADALDPGEDVPGWIASLIRKATDPQPERRLPDMDAFVGWLDAAEASWVAEAERLLRPTGRLTYTGAPPRLQMAQPSLGPSEEILDQLAELREVANRAPTLPAPLTYAAASVLGMVAGVAFSSLVIVFVEVSVR